MTRPWRAGGRPGLGRTRGADPTRATGRVPGGGVVVVALLLAGCSAGRPVAAPSTVDRSPRAAVSGSGRPAATPASGCPAPRTGPPPSWAAGAPDLPYVLSREGNAIGVLFARPLRAGAPTSGPNNKILWVVREPRRGQPLTIVATRPGASRVVLTRAADSGPGEIYPSIVDVPEPGCWQVTLTWGGNRATLGLVYTG